MEPIDYHKTYRIVLNDRPNGYRPDKLALRKLRLLLPKMRIHGFGVYGYNNVWYVLVEDVTLPYNFLGITSSLGINNIPGAVPKLLPGSSA